MSSPQSLLEYFEIYVFPGRSSSVIISDHPAVFKQITKVIVDEELLKVWITNVFIAYIFVMLTMV